MAFAAVALALLLAGALSVIYRLTVQIGRLHLRLETVERFPPATSPEVMVLDGLPSGSTVPEFELPLAAGGGSMKFSTWHGREVLLIFFNPQCAHSLRLVPHLYRIDAERIDREPIPLIVSTGDPDQSRRLFDGYAIATRVMLQETFEVSTLFRARGTPTGYLIDPEGKTAGKMLMGADLLAVALFAPSVLTAQSRE